MPDLIGQTPGGAVRVRLTITGGRDDITAESFTKKKKKTPCFRSSGKFCCGHHHIHAATPDVAWRGVSHHSMHGERPGLELLHSTRIISAICLGRQKFQSLERGGEPMSPKHVASYRAHLYTSSPAFGIFFVPSSTRTA